eukprot:TRINITY_DN16583_c0_g1_i1.p1 TRINITY_DN16583_c0_g1~~TRINITY_DN16583_c0_g1_i1.p1  ORF type:complete len:144 (+),score=37.48 TRINITY_DN16583_c0_g1_i1:35-433(+)
MPSDRFVQIGRVVYVKYGPLAGKVGAIVNIVDQNRILIDGPGFTRQIINFPRVVLTQFVIDIKVGQRAGNVKAAFDEAKITEKFAASSLGQKVNRAVARRVQNDFARFVAQKAKSARTRNVRATYFKLKAKK